MKIWMCAGLLCLLCGCAGREEAFFAQEFDGGTGVSSAAAIAGGEGTAMPGMASDGSAEDAPVAGGEDTAVPGTTAGGSAEGASVAGGEDTAAETERAAIVVDICGAVLHPGVYELREGDRVRDAVQMAGGLLAEADLDVLNQAAVLRDADKIIVYTVQEVRQMREAGQMPQAGAVQSAGSAQDAGQAQDAKVNINLADVSELCTLSGIGESRARDIIAYREANGGFASIEDIMNVSGIKDATFNRIKDEITVQ